MSNSLLPWFQEYIIEIAETYGANISNLPLHPRNKKVQITQFLTYGSENEDTLIWAEISDKQYVIPIKFTKEAVSDYRRSSADQRLTRHKGGIFKIINFRPISTRVPKSNNTLSSESTLVIECTSFSVLGSSGESTFGNPEPILNHPDIKLWSDGLKRDGGAGNVLKERKMQREAKRVEGATAARPIILPPIDQPTAIDNSKPHIHTHITRNKPSTVEAYRAQWQNISRNSKARFNENESAGKGKGRAVEKDAAIAPHTEPLEEDPQTEVEVLSLPRSRSGTPFTMWEPTPSKRAESSTPTPTPPSPNKVASSPPSSMALEFPPPAQRMKKAPMPDSTPDPQHSSYPSGNETVLENQSSNTRNINARRSVPRKIPRPTSPESPRYSGPARILAPNSDTSGTQSQSQSQSQPREAVDYTIEEEGFIRTHTASQKEAEQRKIRRSVLGIDGEMDGGEYPWLDLRHIRDIIARTMEARNGA